MYVCVCVCVYVCVCVRVCVCVSAYRPLTLSFSYISNHLSLYLPIYLSLCLYISLTIYKPICLSVYLSIYLSSCPATLFPSMYLLEVEWCMTLSRAYQSNRTTKTSMIRSLSSWMDSESSRPVMHDVVTRLRKIERKRRLWPDDYHREWTARVIRLGSVV